MQMETISKITDEKKDKALEWMGLEFYYYDGLQPKISPTKHFSRQCTYITFGY